MRIFLILHVIVDAIYIVGILIVALNYLKTTKALGSLLFQSYMWYDTRLTSSQLHASVLYPLCETQNDKNKVLEKPSYLNLII